MPIRYEVDKELRLKTTVFSERVTEHEFVQYSASLSPEQMSQYDVVFVDFSQMTDCDFGYQSISPHAVRASLRNTANRSFNEIILAPTDVAYGLARMYQTLVDGKTDVKLYRDETEARTALANLLDRRESA